MSYIASIFLIYLFHYVHCQYQQIMTISNNVEECVSKLHNQLDSSKSCKIYYTNRLLMFVEKK